MRKESELDILATTLANAREEIRQYDHDSTRSREIILGLEHSIEILSAIVNDAASCGSDVVLLRNDRQALYAARDLLGHEQSKLAMLNGVLVTLQRSHQQLQDEHQHSVQELKEVSQKAASLQDIVDKLEAENSFMSKRNAFSVERSDFYAAEIEDKIDLLDAGLSAVTEMVTRARREACILPELRSSRKIAREMEELLRSTEQSLASERAWSQDKGSEVKRLEACITQLEDRFADRSLQAEKLEKELSESSRREFALQEKVNSMQQLQERLAQTETELDRFQKSHVTLQADNARRHGESFQIEALLNALHDSLALLSVTLVKSLEGGSIALEHLQQGLKNAESLLAAEKEDNSATGAVLSDERRKIADMQQTLRDLHVDMLGKQRYINYLEEQQTSLHSSILGKDLALAEQAKAKEEAKKVEEEERNRLKMRRFISRLTSLEVSRCLNAWRERAGEDVRRRALMKRAAGRIMKKSEAVVFAVWWENVQENKEKKSKEEEKRQRER